jgi:arabinofuranosyltransferase
MAAIVTRRLRIAAPGEVSDDLVITTSTTLFRGLRARYAENQRTNAILIGVVVLMVAFAAWHRWTFDDGFINFRVKQIEAGHGPVYNSGQRVEAFTSPLWLVVLTLADVLTPIRIEWLSVLLGIAGTAGGLAFAMAASRRLWGNPDDERMLPAGALVILALTPFWYFATSGLEGGLTFAWLGGSLYLLARWASTGGRLSVGGLIVLGAGWLIRPELMLFTLAIAAALIIGERAAEASRRGRLRVLWVFVLPVGYQLFRMSYYASVLPNTAFAKEAGGARWGTGWTYLTTFATHYVVWLPVLALVVGAYVPLLRQAGRRERLVVVCWVAAALLTLGYVVRVGGDYVPARLLLPGVFAICGPVAFMHVRARVASAAFVVVALWAGACTVVIRPSAPYLTIFGDNRKNVVTLADAMRGPEGTAYAALRKLRLSNDLLAIPAEPGPDVSPRTAALSAIGVLGYALGTDVEVFDLSGLADPLTAHFTLTHRGLPGHEKFIPPPWLAARLTAPSSNASSAYFTLRAFFIQPMIEPTTGAAFAAQVADARAALGCGDLRRLFDSYRGSLGVGDVVANLGDSVGYSRISIPPDPSAARRKFCG